MSSEVRHPEGIAAVKDWIATNGRKIPPANEIGAVMPACELLVAEDGNFNSPSVKRIAVYGEIDSSGRIAIPAKEIDVLRQLFRRWGETVKDRGSQ